MLLLGTIKNINEENGTKLYYNWGAWHTATFSPATKILKTILFEVKGKNYNERKENLKKIAIEYKNADKTGLKYADFSILEDFLLINGKRYGLLKEFYNGGIL